MPILVILSAAQDLAERPDASRVAGVRYIASLGTTGKLIELQVAVQKNADTVGFDDSSGPNATTGDVLSSGRWFFASLRTTGS